MLGFWLSGYLAWDFPNNFWSLWETLGNEELPTRVGRFHMYSFQEILRICKYACVYRAFWERQRVINVIFSSSLFGFSICQFVLSSFLAHLGTLSTLPFWLTGNTSPTIFTNGLLAWGWKLDGWCQTWLWSFQWGTSTSKIALLWCAWCETWCNYKWDHPCLSRLGGLFFKQLFFDVVAREWNELRSLWEIFSWSSGIVRTVLDVLGLFGVSRRFSVVQRCFFSPCLRKALFEVASRYLTELSGGWRSWVVSHLRLWEQG